jgi:hypothetical protein
MPSIGEIVDILERCDREVTRMNTQAKCLYSGTDGVRRNGEASQVGRSGATKPVSQVVPVCQVVPS